MSRQIAYHDSKLTVITGIDHVLGKFFQIFDKEMEKETPEGLVFDWSEQFGFEINLTGIPNDRGYLKIVFDYVEEHKDDILKKC